MIVIIIMKIMHRVGTIHTGCCVMSKREGRKVMSSQVRKGHDHHIVSLIPCYGPRYSRPQTHAYSESLQSLPHQWYHLVQNLKLGELLA